MVPTPTLGCQIAPSYNHEEWPYNASDSSSDDGGGVTQEQVAQEQPEIEKAETARDTELLRPGVPTPMQSFRTRASRKVPAQEPVGFWHWSMVPIHVCPKKIKFRDSHCYLGWRQTPCSQVVAPD